jgi:O-antigen ligase
MKVKIEDITIFLIFLYALTAVMSITISEIFFIAALICWAVDIIINKKNIKAVFTSPVTLAMVVFAVIHLSSAIFGIDPGNSLRDYRKIYLLLMFFLVMNNLRSDRDIKTFAAMFCAGSGFIGLYAAISVIIQRYINHRPDFRGVSFSGNHMMAGGMLMMGVIAAFGAIAYMMKNKDSNKPLFVLFAVSFVLSAAGLVFTFTRSSWIAALAGVMLIGFNFDKKSVLIMILVLAAGAFFARNTDIVKRASNTMKMGDKTSEMERVHMWNAGLRIIRDNPLKGIGTGNLPEIYPQYKDAQAQEPNAGHLHNNLIQVAVIDGLPGLAAYLWIFTAFWISLYKAVKKEDNIFYKYCLITVFAVNIGFFINGFFEYNLFSSQVALIFWALMGAGYGTIRMSQTSKLTGGIKL